MDRVKTAFKNILDKIENEVKNLDHDEYVSVLEELEAELECRFDCLKDELANRIDSV